MTTRELVRAVARRFRGAPLHYGHGTANALDEAAWLVSHVLRVAPGSLEGTADRPVSPARVRRALALADRRIGERIPLAYLLGEAWIGDTRFLVNRRVIVPRSFIGELIEDATLDALLPRAPRRILDLCAGSGCLGILATRRYARARADLADLSPSALATARRNIALHRLSRRVRALRGDLYDALPRERYDLILSNPPYVDARAMRRLPLEYRAEPALALAGGVDGLDLVRRIVEGARTRLAPNGWLVCEIGHNRRTLERAYPRTPFLWLDTSAGDRFVFALARDDLPA